MTECIELHDSSLDSVDRKDSSVIVRLWPAIVHRSEGVSEKASHTIWLQDYSLVIAKGKCGALPSEFPQDLWDGTLTCNGMLHENEIPIPLDCSGPLSLALTLRSGAELAITGESAILECNGEARFLENFPER